MEIGGNFRATEMIPQKSSPRCLCGHSSLPLQWVDPTAFGAWVAFPLSPHCDSVSPSPCNNNHYHAISLCTPQALRSLRCVVLLLQLVISPVGLLPGRSDVKLLALMLTYTQDQSQIGSN